MVRPALLSTLLLLISASFAFAAEPRVIREVEFVYRDAVTGAEAPVDSPSPQWFAAKTRLAVGRAYSQKIADEDLARFITEHGVLCREIRPEPVPDGVRVVFVFEKRLRAWAVKVVARKGTPSVGTTKLMEVAVKLRRDHPVGPAAVDADRSAIVEHLRRQGYHFAAVEGRVKPVKNRPGFVDVTFEVDRGPKVQPEKITFTGNAAFSRGKLLRLMQTKEDGWLTSRRFAQKTHETDVENIKRHYLAQGWDDVEVTARPVLFDPEFVIITVSHEPRSGKNIITGLNVRGARTVGTRTVRGQLLCQKGREFTPTKFQRDIRWLRARYDTAGFHVHPQDIAITHEARDGAGRATARIAFTKKPDAIRKGPGDRSVAAYIRIDIREGDRYFVESVTFEGVSKKVLEDHIRDRLKMTKGSLFTQQDLAADLLTLRTVYQENGYADVQVALDRRLSRPGQKTYDLKYIVKEGPLYTIDIVRPRGNDKTRPDVITREMAIKPGERYDIRKIAESERRLRNLQHFSSVKIVPADSKRPAEPGKQYKELHVHVQEAITRRLMIGAGASSAGGVFGDFRFHDTNFDLGDPAKSWSDFVSGTAFAGGGQTLAIFLRPGSERSEFGIHWQEPWLNQRPIELGVSAGYFSRDWDEYTVDKLGGTVTLGKRYRPGLTGFVGLRLHRVDVTDINRTAPPDVWSDRGEHTVLGLFAGLTHNTIDNKAFPTSGAKRTLTAELVGTPAFDIVKLIAEGRWYHPVYEAPDKSRHVVSLWGETGIIAGSDVPVFERFYAGGLGSVRGFATHGISPLNNRIFVAPPGGPTVPVRTGDPIGGKFLIEGGVEYYFPIVKNRARGLVFLDAGSVAENSLGIGTALSDLRVSTGVGLHLALPQLGGAPVALYLGVPLKKESGDETEAFTFSIGIMLP